VSENRVLRRIFGAKREAARGWRRLHNEELNKLYQILLFFPMAFYSPLRTYAFLNRLLDPIDIW
jgi:hypothetical protein